MGVPTRGEWTAWTTFRVTQPAHSRGDDPTGVIVRFTGWILVPEDHNKKGKNGTAFGVNPSLAGGLATVRWRPRNALAQSPENSSRGGRELV